MNIRWNQHVLQYERCLDYENEPHVCSFPDTRPAPQRTWTSGGFIYWNDNGTGPRAWVKPSDRREEPSEDGS